MSTPTIRLSLLVRYYRRYLDEGSIADFVRAVASTYHVATLQRIAQFGSREARRAAVLALALLGKDESVATLGQSLQDHDRAVRVLAEDGLMALFCRVGSFEDQQQLQWLTRQNASGEYDDAIQVCDTLLADHPNQPELWYQRGEALRGCGNLIESVRCYQRAIDCEPYHFHAGLAMADVYLDLGDLPSSIQTLYAVLQVHPHLELARAQVHRLERELREPTDRS